MESLLRILMQFKMNQLILIFLSIKKMKMINFKTKLKMNIQIIHWIKKKYYMKKKD
jgi:hypothetical protein